MYYQPVPLATVPLATPGPVPLAATGNRIIDHLVEVGKKLPSAPPSFNAGTKGQIISQVGIGKKEYTQFGHGSFLDTEIIKCCTLLNSIFYGQQSYCKVVTDAVTGPTKMNDGLEAYACIPMICLFFYAFMPFKALISRYQYLGHTIPHGAQM
jgi:hypothetical protein